MINTIVECNKLSKKYSNNYAVDKLTFRVNRGERVMLLGANGAGKTTTLNLLLGLEGASSGSVLLQQKSPSMPGARKNLGVMLQESDFINELTVLETMRFIMSHYSDTFSVDELLQIFMLDSFKNKSTSKLSLGQKRRLALALAFLNKPKTVFLDEPTAGLDVESRNQILSFVQNYCDQPDITLLLTTHYLEEADRLVERIIYLQEGKIKIDCSIDEFKSTIMQTQIQFFCDAMFDKKMLTDLVTFVEKNQNQFSLLSETPDQVVRCLVKNNVPFYNLKVLPPSLEAAYLTLREREKHVAQPVY